MKPIAAAALRRRLLDANGFGPNGAAAWRALGLEGQIERLGFVQVDSVRAVERAHDMILAARDPRFRPAQLRAALEKKRSLFEHWTHDAAIVPSGFHPYWRRRFRRDERALAERWARWRGEGFRDERERVFAMIDEEGPISARALEDRLAARDGRAPDRRKGMWAWNPVKTALEHGWRAGRYAIAGRMGFEKLYDLAERALPDAHAAGDVADDDLIEWAAREALVRLVAATPGEIARFWDLIDLDETKAWAARGVDRGRLREILVASEDGARPRKLIAFDETARALEESTAAPRRFRVLNPFDPLLRDRKRVMRLFAFDFVIELFKPKAQRRYGYYVFPALDGDKLVGRLDLDADRKKNALVLRAYWPEAGAPMTTERKARLDAELERWRDFSGLAAIEREPGWLREIGG